MRLPAHPKRDKPQPAALSPRERSPRRKLWITAVLVVLSAAVTAAVWADWYFGVPADAQATFVGRGRCITCHQAQHAAWTGSHHDLAMDLATDKTVLGDFSGAKLEHYGITSRMFRRDGKFFINTEGPDGQLADFEVKYVFGVDPLQQYMVEFDRPADMPAHEIARVQVLRVSWDTNAKKWFHLDPPDVREKLAPDDDLHWTGIAQRWNNMCADCHSTNLQKNFDVESLTYHTTFSEIDVSCEACHGPGSLHVQLAAAISPFWDRERGYALAQLKGQSTQGEIQACAHCHSRRQVVSTGYTAGCNYYDYFSNETLTPTSYHADGQILDEVYEYGSFLQSKMYHKGIRCTDCHDPHTARLKHAGNKVCTSCHQHPAGKYDGFNHHRHSGGSRGTQCVDCHMPETTYMAVDPRRDHSFRVPRPDLSVKLGTPNACTGCHMRDDKLPGVGSRELEMRDRGSGLKDYAAWLQAAARGDDDVKDHLGRVDRWANEQLNAWYGENRRREPHFAEALAAARAQSPEARQKLVELANDRTQPAIARATALQELAAYPGSVDVTKVIAAQLSDRDPQVRAAALSVLSPAEREVLLPLAKQVLADEARVVRVEAARVLSRLPPLDFRGQERRALLAAIDEAENVSRADNDRAGGHMMRGVMLESVGSDTKAEQAYRTAIRVEPSAVGPRANLAALLDRRLEDTLARVRELVQSQNVEAAKKLLTGAGPLEDEANALRDVELGLLERDALHIPDNAALQTRLGLLRYLRGWRKEAEFALQTANRLEPRTPEFPYHLAIYLRDTGRPREALELARRLRELRPLDPRFEALEDETRRQLRAGPAP